MTVVVVDQQGPGQRATLPPLAPRALCLPALPSHPPATRPCSACTLVPAAPLWALAGALPSQQSDNSCLFFKVRLQCLLGTVLPGFRDCNPPWLRLSDRPWDPKSLRRQSLSPWKGALPLPT